MATKLLKPKLHLAIFFSTLFQLYSPSISIHHSLPKPRQIYVQDNHHDYPFRTTFLQTGENTPCAELDWRLDAESSVVEFRLRTSVIRRQATVSEWIAFGMSANGSLIKADLIVFWLNGNKVEYKDSWTDNSKNVHKDSRQDYSLQESVITTDNHLQLVFSRNLDTCDHRDYQIENGTVNLLFLRGYHGQSLSENFPTIYNQTTFAMRRVQIMKGSRAVPNMPRDIQINEVLVDKIEVPTQTTTYWCKVHKFPHINFKHHIIRYEAVVTPGNEDLVHHMEVYHCESHYGEPLHSYSGPCSGEKKPSSLVSCKHVIGAWAMGAGPFIYPEEVGVAIGDSGTSPYVMIEVHYNNPTHRQGVVDSSGIRFYYTPTLRPNDAGILEVGVVYSPNQSIPPNSPDFVLTGYCSSACTKAGLPEGGVKVFASQLHTHLTGTAVWTEHMRGGIELDELNRDNHYSAHFQEIRLLPKDVQILPGDTLITRCRYDTRRRTEVTLGGYGIEDEMCVNYIHYYPRGNLEVCKSSVSERALYAFLKHVGDGLDDMSPADGLRHVTWDSRIKQLLQNVIQRAPIDSECLQSSGLPFPGEWTNLPPPIKWISRPKGKHHCPSMDWKHLLSRTFHIQ